MPESNIKTSLTVDDPIELTATYKFTREDRRYLDNQIRAIQQVLVDSLMTGVVETYCQLYAASEDVEPGDCVCLISRSADGRPIVTKALEAALEDAGAVFGIATVSATGGGDFRVAIAGSLPPTVTDLEPDQGFVRVDISTARCEMVVALAGDDFPVGVVDSSGQLAIQFGVGGGGGSFTAAGDLDGNEITQQVVALTGAAGVLPVATTGATIRWHADTVTPTIKQDDETTNADDGDVLTIQAQNSTGTTTVGGGVVLRSGTGTTRAGNVVLGVGAFDILTLDAQTSTSRFWYSAFNFGSSVGSPILSQDDETGNSVDGANFLVAAQDSTGTTTVGGKLRLASGLGTTRAGDVAIITGGFSGTERMLFDVANARVHVPAYATRHGATGTGKAFVDQNAPAYVETAGNTQTTLDEYPIDTNRSVDLSCTVTARKRSDGALSTWDVRYQTYRNAGSATELDDPVITALAGNTLGTVSIDADIDSNSARLRVTGIAATDIDWGSTGWNAFVVTEGS